MMCEPIVLAATTEVGEARFDLDLPADLPCFQGHFPGLPVLAGVVQLDWAMRLAAAHLRCGQPTATDFRVKYKRVIMPGLPLTLTLAVDAERHRLDFTYRSRDLVASQGRVVLAAP
jgi:3-hydroxymyristoyl/3-hydroxydecanoyl-(acyl carrier protein) dehydratase